jgi:hypothetical protein
MRWDAFVLVDCVRSWGDRSGWCAVPWRDRLREAGAGNAASLEV